MNGFERCTNAAIDPTLRSPPRSSERSKNVLIKNIPNNNKNARSLSRSSTLSNTLILHPNL